MASSALTSMIGAPMMPYLAILQHDLRTLWQSRLVRLWLAATVVLTLLLTVSNWGQLQTAPLIGALLFPYLVFPWFLVVIVLGVNPVSGARTEALADGILSRPITRYEYLLGAWSARVVLVLGAYLVVTLPAIVLVALAKRPFVPEDPVTVYGVVSALGLVALVLTLLVSLGFLAGTLLRRPLLAVVVLVFVWFPINLVLNVFSLEEFSPISLDRAIPTLVRQPWREAEEAAEDDTQRSNAHDIVKHDGNTQDLDPTALAMPSWKTLFTGEESKPKPKPKPEPKDTESGFFDGDEFDDFSTVRVALGYTLPTVMAVVLATFCMYWRDL